LFVRLNIDNERTLEKMSSSNFNLYHLTLQPPTAIVQAVAGNFSSDALHEFVVARGGFLEVLRRDTASDKLRTVHREQAFGAIRNLGSIRIHGHSRDLLVVTSDSGRLSFLKFTGTRFERLSLESFGKAGIRRTVPGEYVATDPAGRAVMIGAIEKEKFVFATNRDAQDQLFVSSPLEAHKPNTITFAIVGIDVGFDNPLFAALETTYDDEDDGLRSKEAGKKMVVFYEVDLGLNHVVRKFSKQVSDTANHLVAVPPSGVVVCSAEGLEWVKPNEPTFSIALPRREWDDPKRGEVLVISSASFQTTDLFFALLQTERGDLFKLTPEADTKGKMQKLVLKYFDSISPACQICISKDGLLFAASEFGNHELFQFKAIGDSPDDDSVEISSSSGNKSDSGKQTFTPRNQPLNLELFDSFKSLAPIVSLKVSDLAKDAGVNQIYTLCGRAERSTLRTLRQGLPLAEMGTIRFPVTSKQDVNRGVWTIRGGADRTDKFIIVALKDSTKVFSTRTEGNDDEQRDVIEDDVSERFARDTTTITASAWGTKGADCIQVTPTGFRRVNFATNQVVSTFKCSGQKRVEVACCNDRQICLGLTQGEIIYFEIDSSGAPVEKARYDVGLDVACMDCDTTLLALGLWDSSIRILSVERSNMMAPLSSQKVPAKPSSLCLIRDESRNHVRMEVGLQNGLLVRSILDIGSSGAIVDTRSHVLGSKAVRVQKVYLNVTENGPAEQVSICCSTRIWLVRASSTPTPLSFRSFEFVAPFLSATLGGREGMVALGPSNSLTITLLDGFGLDPSRKFNEEAWKLDRTPRRICRHPTRQDLLILIEGDRDSFLSQATVNKVTKAENGEGKEAKRDEDAMDVDEEEEEGMIGTGALGQDGDQKDPSSEVGKFVGHPRQSDPDMAWASCVRVISPLTGQTLQRIQLEKNEMAVSLEQGRFADGIDYLFVGTVSGMKFHPRQQIGTAIRTYRFLPSGGKLELVHTTKTQDIPLAFAFIDGKLCCGAGQAITLYDMGQKQLLRKCELKGLPSLVAFIKPVSADRLCIGDSHESIYFVYYSKQENSFSVFADDIVSRMCVAGDIVDSNTCAASDKFGNVFVLRLPPGATGTDPRSRAAHHRTALWDQGNLGGAPHKLDLIAHFYVGEVVTALQKCTLAPGRNEILVYGTVMGTLGALTPFLSRDDLDFFSHLEIHLRKHFKNLLGRDHLQYRSYYTPVKCVIDGDLCEQYFHLPEDIKSKIAREMDRSVDDICRRLEEMRGQILW
jgi:splicing factor 3B subunit 3